MGSKVEQLENESDDPHIECYKHNSFLFQFDKLKHLVDEPQNLIKQNCDQFEKLGEYGFQNA